MSKDMRELINKLHESQQLDEKPMTSIAGVEYIPDTIRSLQGLLAMWNTVKKTEGRDKFKRELEKFFPEAEKLLADLHAD